MEESLLQGQNILGKRGLLLLVFLLNMTAPLSTDIYLPAFPIILKELNTSSAILNYTLVGFFISFALGMLFLGPVSDKFGRKPLLITSINIYFISSFCCAQSSSIEALILFRIIQGIGAGGMVSVSTAIVKDSFNDAERPNIIALLQMLGAFAPTVAPLIGAQIIRHFHWHISFIALAGIAVVSLLFSLLYQETLPKQNRLNGNILDSILSLKQIVKEKPFMTFLIAMGGTSLIYMGFLAVSSYIYIQWFQLSETTYSIYFAINSLLLIIGPRVYVKVRTIFSAKRIINISFASILLSASLLLLFGKSSPYVFLICFAPITFGAGFLRSFSTNILLGQENMNAGATSSIINFSNTAIGALGMFLATLGWENFIHGISYIAIIGTVFSLGLWQIFKFNNYKLKGI